MPHEEDPTEQNRLDPQFRQTAVSNVTARDIQIGQIVQRIVHLGLPFNSRHLRFVQFLANSAYLTCLMGGFIRLWRHGADLTTLLLLIFGSGLLSLTCLYYVWFWKPEVQDKNAPNSEPSDSDERVKTQQTRHRSRQQTRRLAMIGIFAIPLLTWGGFLGWQALPSTHILLLVANFDGSNSQDYQVTETILRNLRHATEDYADVQVQALNQTITEQQGSDVARAAGERQKATIVIWGEYGVTATDVQLSVHYELLKPPETFPELGEAADGKAQIAAIAELNSFKLQTRLSDEMTYLTLFTLGTVRYAEEDWGNAIDRFSAALAQVKGPVKVLEQDVVYFYRGYSYLSKGDDKNAIADYTQALKLKPDYAEVYNNRGVAYTEQGKYTEAFADYTQALKLKPDAVLAYSNRGSAYRNQGKYTEAFADYTQALKLKPDYAEAYNNRGVAYAYQGKYDEAIADYTQALKLKPDLAQVYSNRGDVYTEQGKYTDAIVDLNQALQLKPDYAYAYNNRGRVYTEQGKYDEAIVDYTQALKLKPDLAEVYNNRGVAYTEQGKYDEAIADLNQSLKLKPDYAYAYYNKAYVYSLERKVKEAIENLQQAINLDPKWRDYARTDSNFDNIRQDQQFQALVGQ